MSKKEIKAKKKSKKERTADPSKEQTDANKAARDEEPAVTKTIHTEQNNNDDDDDDDNEGDNVADPEADESDTAKKRRKRKRKRKKGDDDDDDDKAATDTAAAGEPVVAASTIATDATKAQEVDRTVYVEGIPFTATPSMVQQFFIDGGCRDVTDLRLPVWHDSGRLRGYGHVVFASPEGRAHALASLSGKYLQGRYLTLQPAVPPKVVAIEPVETITSEPSKTIALHNLSYAATEDDVAAVLEKFGTIAPGGVRIVRHSGSHQSKGFGYVEFTHVDTAVAVLTATTTTNPVTVLGRPCRIDYDHGRMKGSFRTADRKLWQKEYGTNNTHNNSNSSNNKQSFDSQR
jgi:nucleolin